MKKRAIKGLVALACVVALCMFFSGTIKTISTAKVKLVTARQGRLEQEIRLSGQLIFPKTQDIELSELESSQSLIIKRVRVSKGRHVEAGDVLFEAEVANYAQDMETLMNEYGSAQKELLELERKHGDVRLKRTEEIYIQAYDALSAAKQDVLSAKTALQVAAQLAGVTLTGGELPEGIDDETLLARQQALTTAREAEKEAQRRFDNANRLGISEDVLTYVSSSRELRAKMDRAQQKIAALNVLSETVREVKAPHEGYIVQINVTAGETYSGATAAMVISEEKTRGVLRADASEIERRIQEGTQISIERSNGKNTSKKVTATGIDSEGKRYVDVELSDKDITNLGGGAALMSAPVEMKASYRAESSSTLLPASAVRGTGDARYIYTVSEQMDALGSLVLKVQKRDVTVLAEVGGTVSISEDLGRERVAYMEDRAISDGSEVMLYAQ